MNMTQQTRNDKTAMQVVSACLALCQPMDAASHPDSDRQSGPWHPRPLLAAPPSELHGRRPASSAGPVQSYYVIVLF